MDTSILTMYCERGLATGLISEPINTITNLAFLVFGYMAYRLFKEKGVTNRGILMLPYLFGSIGLGSLFFHTWRNTTTVIFDAVPIYLFILFALFLLLKKLFRSSHAIMILFIFIIIEISLSAYVPKDLLNGSIRHVVAWVFISVVAYFAYKKYKWIIKTPLVFLLVFYAVGIFFRSMDMELCSFIPTGTHFMWHICTAIAGYQAMKILAIIHESK